MGPAWLRSVYRFRAARRLVSSAMEPITILNRCHRFRGFATFSPDHKSIEVSVRPRKSPSTHHFF
jgi:hypothetical protein